MRIECTVDLWPPLWCCATPLLPLGHKNIGSDPKTSSGQFLQDKFVQKQHFEQHSIPLADFQEVHDAAGGAAAGEQFGFPFMLKSRRRALAPNICTHKL